MKLGYDCLLLLICISLSLSRFWTAFLAFVNLFLCSFHFLPYIFAVRRKESQPGLIEFCGKWKITVRHQKKANSLKKRTQFLFLWLTISVTWAMASVITNLSQELSSLRCAVPVILLRKVCFTQCCLRAADFLNHNLRFILIVVKAANCFQVISSHLKSPTGGNYVRG